uniref:Growth hormone n=1 Tax=Oncorhynchus tshawytscha TaxID=74940 RepID=A0AAZ3Q8R7_ONCTS
MPVLLFSCFLGQGEVMENQQLFNIAVNRVQQFHLLAQKMSNDFEGTLFSDERRQLNKISQLDIYNSDFIMSPIDKQETQKTSVLNLLHISFHLIESWQYSSQTMTISNSLMVRNSNQISKKLSDHKVGINLLIKVKKGGRTMTIVVPSLKYFGKFYKTTFEIFCSDVATFTLKCVKYNLFFFFSPKVETYLTVAKCRQSLEANCTL